MGSLARPARAHGTGNPPVILGGWLAKTRYLRTRERAMAREGRITPRQSRNKSILLDKPNERCRPVPPGNPRLTSSSHATFRSPSKHRTALEPFRRRILRKEGVDHREGTYYRWVAVAGFRCHSKEGVRREAAESGFGLPSRSEGQDGRDFQQHLSERKGMDNKGRVNCPSQRGFLAS